MVQVATTENRTGQAAGFWLVYAASEAADTLADALHALYYLPESFRLIVMSDDMQRDKLDTMGHIGLKNRVKIVEKTGTAQDESPFLIADVIISDHKDHAANKPHVVISGRATDALESDELSSGFTVASGNPAAVATAVHSLARSLA